MVETHYGLPAGSILHHRWFDFQQRRSGDDRYYVAPRAEAEDYARSGGEALGDALHAAFELLHPGQEGALSPDGKKWAWAAWVDGQVGQFGSPQLAQVDVPHDVLRGYGSGFTSWPSADDTAGWQERAARMAGVVGIGLTPAQRARTRIELLTDWADRVAGAM